jgi:subtilisin family serine protease
MAERKRSRKQSSSKKSAPRQSSQRRPRNPGANVSPPVQATSEEHFDGEQFARTTIPPDLNRPEKRLQWGLPESAEERGPYIVELNLQHAGGIPGAANAFKVLFDDAMNNDQSNDTTAASVAQPMRIAKTYYRCELTVSEVQKLAALDERRAAELAQQAQEKSSHAGMYTATSYRVIYRIWPDFPVSPHTDRSVATIKADAALRAFDASGNGITWAVIDSGVEVNHPHFGEGTNHILLNESVADLHRCFADLYEIRNGLRIARGPLADPDLDPDMDPARRAELLQQHQQAALTDEFGHGTHVSGIIAGRAPLDETIEVYAMERQHRTNETGNGVTMEFNRRPVADRSRLRGVAPECKLISLRVLDDQGNGRTSNVIRALEYIREHINDDPKLFRVHGVNLSVGYEFDAEMFACGQSPLCTEVDRLVQAGVVVIAAAGNTGYGTRSADARATKGGLATTINDPGNAALAITVGATHRDAPHTYGVSYFSSKGPTGDGRLKPDLVAPGERITSCAAGKKLQDTHQMKGCQSKKHKISYYVDDSGTSMAAPHVSGAIASFLSIRREFIGKPLEVKEIFLNSATSLGRERYFEGHGLVDLMRAIQSV